MKSRPYKSEVEHELDRRTLVSERLRTISLLASLIALFIVRLAYHGVHGFREDLQRGGGYTLVLAFWIALEALSIALLNQEIRAGRERVPFRAYVSAALDVAMPTAAMAIMCLYDRPLNVVTNSVNYVYFLIIILSPLRLDFWLCVFTGALSAGAYAGIVVSYYDELARQWAGSAAILHLTFFMRWLLLLIGGLAAGFVSQRMRITLVETLSEMQERERVVALFGQHVSPAVVNQLLSQRTGVRSELREVCVMVVDIRNFTTYSEGRAADEVVRYLNQLWGFMVHTVNEHHGIVNKFLGDGFLAIFGAPLSTGNDCSNAIAAARRILFELDGFAADGTLPPTKIGIALHAGQAIVGNVGSAERKEYTVIGDVVNVAFRIEALNKELGSTLLISEPVRQVSRVEIPEEMLSVAIRGRRDPVGLFRLA